MLAEKRKMARSKETGPLRRYNKIAEILEKRERPVAWLARKAKVSIPYLHAVCKQESQPTLNKLFQIADALDLKPCELLGDGKELKD